MARPSRECLRVVGVVLLAAVHCSALVAAPVPAPQGPSPAAAVRAASAAPVLVADGAALRGDGAGYKVVFGDDGVEFVPAFGPAAERNFPLRYELLAVGRGGEPGERGEPVAVARGSRSHEGLRVEYRRGALTERYDLERDAIEQSFVIDALPAGDGDLVVRGRLTTALEVTPDAGGLRFTRPGLGHLTLGAVTGIDAAGRRVAGTVEYHDGVVDYVLPAAFVRAASLPLVVDPRIGNSILVSGNGTDFDDLPDAAYDATNDIYLVVFVRHYSATDWDIHAQRVDGNGALVGNRILVDNSGAFDWKPQVANVALRDRFVVVWQHGNSGNTDLFARSVAAADGSLGPTVAVVATAAAEADPDVGGEATDADEDALLVWHDQTNGEISAGQIGVNPDGTIFVHDITFVNGLPGVKEPRIGKSGGATGNHMLVWMRDYGGSDQDPLGQIVDRELAFLGNYIPFDSAVNYTTAVDVDGDGERFTAVWQVREATGTLYDVVARTAFFDARANTARILNAITPVKATAGIDETDPSIAWIGNGMLVACTYHQTSTSTSVWAKTIDPSSCLECEVEERLVGSLTADSVPAAVGRRSGGSASDGALVAFQVQTTGSKVHAYRWDGAAGTATTLQPGCGDGGGVVSATCARNGNAGFAIRLDGAHPSAPAWLVGSPSAANVPCGACTFIPDPYAGFVHATTTSAAGGASLGVPIPAGPFFVGVTVNLQWVVFDPVTPGCFLFGSDLSSAIRVVAE